jgi:hypothetical protein
MLAPPDWNMELLWESKYGQAQMEERENIRRTHGLYNPTQGWGRFHRIPAATPLYKLSQL